MAQHSDLDRAKVQRLLIPKFEPVHVFYPPEEHLHPWTPIPKNPFHSTVCDKPLLRTWDCWSGSQPDLNDHNCMRARVPDQRLDTKELRRVFLTMHINHGIWEDTPFISFNSSQTDFENLARERHKSRGNQTVVVIDPKTRVQSGLPVLNAESEMGHYGIIDPYGKSNEYYVNHWICPWQVNGSEVVGTWSWEELSGNDNWYEDIIMPAFRQYRSSLASTLAAQPPNPVILDDNAVEHVASDSVVERLVGQYEELSLGARIQPSSKRRARTRQARGPR